MDAQNTQDTRDTEAQRAEIRAFADGLFGDMYGEEELELMMDDFGL